MSKNEFIQNLKQTYLESLKNLDDQPRDLIENGSEMSAIFLFYEHVQNITETYETAKSIYTLIYGAKDILAHFESSKTKLKLIPLTSFFKEDKINESDLRIYKRELNKNFSNFLDESENFDSDAFVDYLVRTLLDKAGYNKSHWYLKQSFINELEFMLDFLLKFVEIGFNPIKEDNTEGLESDRHIPKAVKIDVWRRDLGKCTQCGSQEKLEYDHIIPVAKGGSNTARNVQLLCEKCNRSKSDSIQ
jgi:hypothetical protein